MGNNGETAFFLQPFFIGLYIGLILSLAAFIKGKLDLRKLKKEQKDLKRHLHTKMDIDSQATEQIKGNVEQLKKENENLRISLQALYNKPGRLELKELHLYHKAVSILMEKAPGFAPSWQMALKEAEEELKNTDKGVVPFLRKFFPGSHGSSRPQLEQGAEDEGKNGI